MNQNWGNYSESLCIFLRGYWQQVKSPMVSGGNVNADASELAPHLAAAVYSRPWCCHSPVGFIHRELPSQILFSLLITWGSFQVSVERTRDSEFLPHSQAMQVLQLHRLLSGQWRSQQGYKQQPLELSKGWHCIGEVGILWYGQRNGNWFSAVRDLVICEGMLLTFESEDRFRKLNFDFLDDIRDF